MGQVYKEELRGAGFPSTSMSRLTYVGLRCIGAWLTTGRWGKLDICCTVEDEGVDQGRCEDSETLCIILGVFGNSPGRLT